MGLLNRKHHLKCPEAKGFYVCILKEPYPVSFLKATAAKLTAEWVGCSCQM